jgi:hypothetical protein
MAGGLVVFSILLRRAFLSSFNFLSRDAMSAIAAMAFFLSLGSARNPPFISLPQPRRFSMRSGYCFWIASCSPPGSMVCIVPAAAGALYAIPVVTCFACRVGGSATGSIPGAASRGSCVTLMSSSE